jgi:hypothetical protein
MRVSLTTALKRSTTNGKQRPRFVDRRRQQRDAEPVTFEDIDERLVEALAIREHRRHELGRVVSLQPRRLIRLDAVGGAVRFAEGVTVEADHQLPHFRDLGLAASALARAGGELPADLGDLVPLLFDERAPQHVGATGRQAGKGLADLQDLLLIDDQAERTFQARFERRMRIGDRFESLVAAGELLFFLFVGRAGADHADDGDETVNVAHVAHAAEADHGRAFDVMHRARAAAGDQFPHFRIIPRIRSGGVPKCLSA